MEVNKFKLVGLFLMLFCFYDINYVKADEMFKSSDYRIYINEIEIDNYILSNDDKANILQVYDGINSNCLYEPVEELIIDYSDKLYGEYKYNFSLVCDGEILDSREVIIDYVGDNNDIINNNGIYYKNGNYFLFGYIDKGITVEDVIELFDDSLSNYSFELAVVDNNGIELLESDIVENGYKLKVSGSYDDNGDANIIEDEFILNIVTDVNSDDNIDNLDLKCIMFDSLFKNDGLFEIDDFLKLDGDLDIDSSDILHKNLEYDNTVYAGDIFELKYYLNGFSNDSLDSVMGNIYYDTNLFELISVETRNIYGKFDEKGNFGYLLDNYNSDGLFIIFKFKALNSGDGIIKLEKIDATTMDGNFAVIDNPLFESNISVLDLEFGKGGDVNEVYDTINNDINIEKYNFFKNEIVYEELLPSKTTKHILLSNDNYIEKLEIEGYDIKFSRDVLEYFIEVDNDVSKLDLKINLSDNDSYYEIIGNEKFRRGNNKVSIVVTSLDGSSRTYVINVKKLESESNKNGKNSSKNIIVLLLVLIIIGLIYIIFQDDK